MQQELVRRLSKLTQAAQAMTRCQEVGELLDTILRLVEEVFHLDTCAVLLLDKATGALRIERARGYDPHVLETFEGAVGRGITGRAVRDGKLTFVPDVQADPDYVGGVTGAVSEIAVPLRLNGTIIGVLDAEVRQRTYLQERRDRDLHGLRGPRGGRRPERPAPRRSRSQDRTGRAAGPTL